MSLTRWSACLALVLSLPACSGDSSQNDSTADGAQATGELPAQGTFVGKVAETMDAGTYTYVRLEGGGRSVWAAGPQGPVTIGETIGVSLAMKMEKFHSETLNRTFDALYFVERFQRTDTKALGGSTDNPHTDAPTSTMDLADIDRPEGGIPVAELWSNKTELVGQSVVLRGRVVKYNGGILGRNWLHVQDGSGDAASGTHDITVTTRSVAKVGDLVTVRGVLHANKDFGGGYAYELIVEEADVTVEAQS